MEKAKFYVDYCFEAGVDHVCQRYWFEIDMTEEEFEDLYQVWFSNNCELNSWNSDWQGYYEMFQRIDDAATYTLNQMLAKYEPEFVNPVEVLWEISKETIDRF